MPLQGKIIVLRFSAMGDVAMVASVLQEFAAQHPAAELVMVSREAFRPFFEGINNVTFHPIHPKTLHKGVNGLYKLYKELKQYQAVAIADLHDNLRSRAVCTFFRLSGIEIERIDKGRAEKWALTRTKNKVFKPLKQTVERYADVFRALGFEMNLSHRLVPNPKEIPAGLKEIFAKPAIKKIGIAPFAQHVFKVYPLVKMEEVIAALDTMGYQLFVYGGGNEEKKVADQWEAQFKTVNSLIGKVKLREELDTISNLDLMLSMDSAGMHMASLMGVPVVSIWGPTHPYAGFLGYGQAESDCIQIDHPNRPNSIYGNKPCLCDVNPCIELITPTTIVNKLKERLTHG